MRLEANLIYITELSYHKVSSLWVKLFPTFSVPADFHDVLMSYTKHGYRVLALAHRALPEKINYTRVQRIQRYRGSYMSVHVLLNLLNELRK